MIESRNLGRPPLSQGANCKFYPAGCIWDRLVLPNADDGPPGACQRSRYASISFDCLLDLLVPESCVPLRTHSVLTTAMPPAAILEYGYFRPGEYDIWSSPDVVEADRKILSEPKAAAVELATQCELRFSVGAPVTLHGSARSRVASLGLCYDA